MRICTCCNKKKKASDFNLKHRMNKKSGIVQYHFTSFCRECLNEKSKEYYNKNREKRKEYQRKYNQTSAVTREINLPAEEFMLVFAVDELNWLDLNVAQNRIDRRSSKSMPSVVPSMLHHL